MKVTDKITITNEDNMLLMARYPDNYFDLAIVDPPYGIHNKITNNGNLTQSKGNKFAINYDKKQWDKFRPINDYWEELLRVSKNQIVCGGNYFAEKLPVSRGWIVWDKQGEGMSSVNNELIYTSFDISIKTFSRCHGLDKGFMAKGIDKVFHPTQKPQKLYKWLLDNYAKEGDKILDTHLGSGSIAIACHDYGFELTACELDKEYYDKAIQRITNHTNQQKLF
jgi:site-specific DNA-methyltransferase (adenine-specific)